MHGGENHANLGRCWSHHFAALSTDCLHDAKLMTTGRGMQRRMGRRRKTRKIGGWGRQEEEKKDEDEQAEKDEWEEEKEEEV